MACRIFNCVPAGEDIPVQEIMVWKGVNVLVREGIEEVTMSQGRVVMPRDFSLEISVFLMGLEDVMVDGRRRTVREGWCGCKARAVRTAVPSSPAPRTRMEVLEDMVGLVRRIDIAKLRTLVRTVYIFYWFAKGNGLIIQILSHEDLFLVLTIHACHHPTQEVYSVVIVDVGLDVLSYLSMLGISRLLWRVDP